MASAGGLTRRRGGGRVAGADENDDSRVSSPISRNGSSLDNRLPDTSFTSENGHKIAFDPRDLSESKERSKQPKLTLMEDILLLGLKDKQVGPWTDFGLFLLKGILCAYGRVIADMSVWDCYRVICLSGTRTSHMPCAAVL